MIVKNSKLIKCNSKEYATIKKIYLNSSCLVNAINEVVEHFFYESKAPMHSLRNVAYNMISAVINNYKYLKVMD